MASTSAETPLAYSSETTTVRRRSASGSGNATGRRKEAVARVRLVPGTGQIKVNGRTIESYFPNKVHQQLVKSPLARSTASSSSTSCAASPAAASAARPARFASVSPARCILIDPENRPTLKKAGYLTRDARVIERKKYGLKKARKAPQYSKR